MGAGVGAMFNVDGGTVNLAGRLNSANAFVNYTQSAGQVNVCVAGGCTTSPSFGFTGASVVMKMSGGSINLVNSNGLTTADYNMAGTMVYSGGVLNVGTASTATNFTFRAQGQAPAVVVDNTTNNKTLVLSGQLNVWGTTTINPGTTVNLTSSTTVGQTLLQIGPSVANNGAIVVSGNNLGTLNFAGSLQALNGGYAQNYTGTGTFGAPGLRPATLSVQNAPGVTLDPNVSGAERLPRQPLLRPALERESGHDWRRRRDLLTVVQRGATGIAFDAGSFDSSPTYNLGTSAYTLVYSQSQTSVTDRPRDSRAATVASIQILNPTGVTLAGGDLTSTGATALLLNSGTLNTSASNKLIVAGHDRGLRQRRLGGDLGQRPARPHAARQPRHRQHVHVPGRQGLVQDARARQPDDGRRRHGHDRGRGLRRRLGRDGRDGLRRAEPQPLLVGPDHRRRGELHEHDGASHRAGHADRERDRPVRHAQRRLRLDRRHGHRRHDRAEQHGHDARLLRGRQVDRASTISGSFNVGTGGDFATLTAAVAALNSKVMTGPVTFVLTDNTYAGETFPIPINPNGGNSATNTLTIKPASGATPVISGISATALIVLNGIDYVTIDGSNSGGIYRDTTLTNNGTTAASAVIWGQTVGTADPTTNNTIKNLNVSGNATTTTFAGIGFGSSTIGTGTLGTRNDNNRVQNNNVTQLQFGVVSVGSQSAAKNTGTVVTGNTLGGNGAAALGRAGVWVAFDDGAQVTNNTVVNASSNAGADVFGIAMGTNAIAGSGITTQDVANVTVTGNYVGTVLQTNTFSAAGIALGTPNYGTSRIANNSVYGVNANSTPGDFAGGIVVGSAGTTYATDRDLLQLGVDDRCARRDALATTGSYALAIIGANPLSNVRDNALYNTQTATNGGAGGTAGSYAIGLSSIGLYNFFTSNYNDLYT